MATLTEAHVDIEQGTPCRCSAAGASDSDEESPRYTDAESSSGESCTTEIVGLAAEVNEKGRTSSCSSFSDCSVEAAADLENGGGGVVVVSVHSAKVNRSCRICHLSFDGSGSNPESGFTIELGTCEICGSTARNVVGVNEVELIEQWNEANETAATSAPPLHHPVETRRFWQGHRFLNFLLACMVFAFVISWLFHFNVPS
ncbi:hypothetical protein Cgig2_019947 [Carnegiea gigantea]|uniref:Uncharacterized protein n=1 Tax=Carnegiea gigantea TaxID=171969 RepID=A0A9Q1GWU5_9CARY|nr:hypothetical protein Cgig2_019947 [Carnegiea gigantea]